MLVKTWAMNVVISSTIFHLLQFKTGILINLLWAFDLYEKKIWYKKIFIYVSQQKRKFPGKSFMKGIALILKSTIQISCKISPARCNMKFNMYIIKGGIFILISKILLPPQNLTILSF